MSHYVSSWQLTKVAKRAAENVLQVVRKRGGFDVRESGQVVDVLFEKTPKRGASLAVDVVDDQRIIIRSREEEQAKDWLEVELKSNHEVVVYVFESSALLIQFKPRQAITEHLEVTFAAHYHPQRAAARVVCKQFADYLKRCGVNVVHEARIEIERDRSEPTVNSDTETASESEVDEELPQHELVYDHQQVFNEIKELLQQPEYLRQLVATIKSDDATESKAASSRRNLFTWPISMYAVPQSELRIIGQLDQDGIVLTRKAVLVWQQVEVANPKRLTLNIVTNPLEVRVSHGKTKTIVAMSLGPAQLKCVPKVFVRHSGSLRLAQLKADNSLEVVGIKFACDSDQRDFLNEVADVIDIRKGKDSNTGDQFLSNYLNKLNDNRDKVELLSNSINEVAVEERLLELVENVFKVNPDALNKALAYISMLSSNHVIN